MRSDHFSVFCDVIYWNESVGRKAKYLLRQKVTFPLNSQKLTKSFKTKVVPFPKLPVDVNRPDFIEHYFQSKVFVLTGDILSYFFIQL
jgi:hypothetical protein